MTGHVITLGKVVGVFGIKGWVKIQSFSSPLENVFSYKDWTLEFPDHTQKQIKLREGRSQGKGLVAALDGVNDRESAQFFVGAEIKIGKEKLPQLEAGDFYWHQLEGLDVMTVEGVLLGKVGHLMETGANDVLVVKTCQGSLDERERLIPYLPEHVVTGVKLGEGCITVDWDPEF